MVHEDRTRLQGLIEADATHSGGPAKGKAGRGVGRQSTKVWWLDPSRFFPTRPMMVGEENEPGAFGYR